MTMQQMIKGKNCFLGEIKTKKKVREKKKEEK